MHIIWETNFYSEFWLIFVSRFRIVNVRTYNALNGREHNKIVSNFICCGGSARKETGEKWNCQWMLLWNCIHIQICSWWWWRLKSMGNLSWILWSVCLYLFLLFFCPFSLSFQSDPENICWLEFVERKFSVNNNLSDFSKNWWAIQLFRVNVNW